MNHQNLQLKAETEPRLLGQPRDNTRSEEQTIDACSKAREKPGVEIVGRLLTRYNARSLHHKRRVRRTVKVGSIAALLVTLLSAIAMPAAVRSGDTFTVGLIALTLGLWASILIACAFVVVVSTIKRSVLRYYLIQAARKYDDVQVVGPLTEVLVEMPYQQRAAAARRAVATMLTTLLPRLTATDTHLLNAEQRQQLCGILCSGAQEDHDLCIAILQAFAQVGDRSVLTQVGRIADSPAKTRRQRELKAEAQRCLPLLQQRTQHEQASRTLLRAAGPLLPAAETLLRPVAASADVASDHLLRPAETTS